MKLTYFKQSKKLLLLSFITLLLFACKAPILSNKASVQQRDNNIVIQGRVTVQGTASAPLGLTTINIKNKWAWKDMSLPAYGENKRVFANKEGYYKITIEKGDTLVVVPNHIIYGRDNSNYIFSNLDKNQTINVEITKDEVGYQQLIENNPILETNIKNHITNVNPEQLVSVSGTIKSKKTGMPLSNIDVSSGFNNNVLGIGTYHLTDNKGNFNLKVPKGNLCSIQALSPNAIRFTAQNDTIINLHL